MISRKKSKVFYEKRGKNFVGLFLISFISLFLIFSLFSFVSAASITDQLHLNLQVTDSNGNVIPGTYNFKFDISTSSTCSPVVYSNSTTLTTDSRGIISYYLPTTNMNFQQQYYLCYYRDNQLINTVPVARAPYAYTAKNVNVSGIIADSNLNLSNYNLSAKYLFGSGKYLTDLNISALNMSNYFTKSDVLGFNYYNSSNFSINDYYLKSNPYAFYNSTTIPNYALNSSLSNYYPLSNPYGYLNSTTVSGVYVPYTGATTNLDLNNKNLVNVSKLSVGSATPSSTGVAYFNGKVGIGTTAPGAKLDVNGQIRSTDWANVTITESQISNLGNYMQVGAYGLGGAAPTVSAPNTIAGLNGSTTFFSHYSGNAPLDAPKAGRGEGLSIRGTSDQQTSQIWMNSNSFYFRELTSGNWNKLATTDYVDSQSGSGLIGSGTAGYLPAWNGTASLNNSPIYTDGTNVGVGTTSPGAKLDVNSSNLAASFGSSETIGANSYISMGGNRVFFGYNGPDRNAVIQSAGSKGIEFNVNNAIFGEGTAMVIKSGGKVGIGTTSPGAKLDVNGTSIFRGQMNLNSNKIINLANGTSAQDAVTKSQLDAVSSEAGSNVNASISGTVNHLAKFSSTGHAVVNSAITEDSSGNVAVSSNLAVQNKITLGNMQIYKDTNGNMVFRA